MKKAFYNLLPLLIGLGILICDIETKKYALAYVSSRVCSEFPYGGTAIFQDLLSGIDLSLNLVKNTGAAWGLFSQYSDILAYARVGIVLYLGFLIFRTGTRWARRICLTLVTAGALGNLIDQYYYGYVIDMFHFTFWNYDFPVFNVADASIFLGACGLLIFSGKKRS